MIRPATPADADALVALAEATGRFNPLEMAVLRELLGADHADFSHAVAAVENDAIVGFAYYAPVPMTDGTWQLSWIAVRKDQQGRGIGSQLLRHVEDDIRGHGGRVLFIETGSPPHYESTRRFYRKHGYEEHALLQDFYADGDSMVVFRKELI